MRVKIKTEKEVELISYYVVRGISVGSDGTKRVIAEKRFENRPRADEIAAFILECGCAFASVVENYCCIEDGLPFA